MAERCWIVRRPGQSDAAAEDRHYTEQQARDEAETLIADGETATAEQVEAPCVELTCQGCGWRVDEDDEGVIHFESTRAETALADLGFADRSLVISAGFGFRHVAGIEYHDGEQPLAGWRVAERSGATVLLPDKRTRAGKTAAALLKELEPPRDIRYKLPGMPGNRLIGHGRLHSPGLRRMGGYWWVEWGCELPELQTGHPDSGTDPDAVDLGIWERVKLSEYYAVVEAEDRTDAEEATDASV